MISQSQRDERFRQFSLNGNILKVVLYVGLPLALYQSLNQIFKIMDSMMASHINATAASTIAYISQISRILTALGTGLSVGSGLKISEAYGSGDYITVKKRVNTLFALSIVLGTAVLLLILPFTDHFLRLAQTPEEFIAVGRIYFIVELITLVVILFNNVYIAVERARGNSRRILKLNMLVIVTKFSLTAIFVYLLNRDVTSIAVATLIAQSMIALSAAINLTKKDSAFSLSLSDIRIHKKTAIPMIRLAIPVSLEKSIFALGKVMINSMSTLYGALTVGALGISDNITGINTTPQNGFQDGAAAIISQNLGAGKTDRAIKTFWTVLLVNTVVGIILLIPSLFFSRQITGVFTGGDEAFHQLLLSVYYFDAWSTFPLAVNASVMALFYGFGHTQITLLINFSRIYLFRIPVLWFFQNFTNIGSNSIGIVLVISNVAVSLFSMTLALIFLRQKKYCQSSVFHK